MPDWKGEIVKRAGELEDSVLEELAQHLESRYEELGSVDAVMAEWDASELRAKLASVPRREKPRREPMPLGGLWQDVRYALRQFRLSPGFAAVAILSLGLGIGANAAIFQLLNAIRLRSLPVERPDQLAVIRIPTNSGKCCESSSRYSHNTYPMWEQIRDHLGEKSSDFSGVFAWAPDTFDIGTVGDTRLDRNGLWVSGDFFSVLGVQPLLGRVLTRDDDRPGCVPRAVLGYAFWQREFGGDANIVGRKMTLNGHPLEIAGVTGPGFFGVEVGRAYDFAVPICSDPVLSHEESRYGVADNWWLVAMGRLKPGVSVDQAARHLEAASPAWLQAAADPKWNAEVRGSYDKFRLSAFPAAAGVSELRTSYEDPLYLLLGISGLVLFIACANLANLLLARASAREREIAVRMALGASRARLIRQLLVESLMLAAFGATAGAAIAAMSSRALVAMLGADLYVDLGADWRVFAFLIATAAVTCILFGLAPALRATRTEPSAAMKTRSSGDGRSAFGLRRVLVVSQVAVSVVLLVGSLLFVRTLANLLTLDAGFRQDGLMLAQFDFEKLNVPAAGRNTYQRDLLEKLSAIPGVDAAASAAIVPLNGSSWGSRIMLDGPGEPVRKSSKFNRVSPGFFRCLGTPLLAGRDFDARDTLSAPGVAIVNETFVRTVLDGGNPMGRRFRRDNGHGTVEQSFEIVGLVKDTKYAGLREQAVPIIYLASEQENQPDAYSQILLRSNLPPASLLGAVKQTAAATDPRIAMQFEVIREHVQGTLMRERMMASLSSAFGLLALVLATIGLFGLLSYNVARRTHEIGIRMALGADRWKIAGMILREAAATTGAGLGVGLVLAMYLGKSAEKLLYNLKSTDPLTLAAAAGSLALVALAASYLPARRAAKLDPMNALREE